MYYGNPHLFQASPDWSHEFGGPGGGAGSAVAGLQAASGAHGGIPVGLGSGPLAVASANGGTAAGGPTSMTTLNGSGSGGGGGGGGHGGDANVSGGGGGANESGNHIASGLQSMPSPPVTVSGSEMSSPGAVADNSPPQTTILDQTPTKSPFQWMTKNPQPTTG